MTAEQKARMHHAIEFLMGLNKVDFDLSTARRDFIGWMPHVFPELVGWNRELGLYLKSDPSRPAYFEEIGACLFGIREKTAFSLFSPYGQKAVHPILATCNRETGPQEYAKMLLRFLEIADSLETVPVFRSPGPEWERAGVWTEHQGSRGIARDLEVNAEAA